LGWCFVIQKKDGLKEDVSASVREMQGAFRCLASADLGNENVLLRPIYDEHLWNCLQETPTSPIEIHYGDPNVREKAQVDMRRRRTTGGQSTIDQ
jgi:hypothetical protein